MEKEKEIAVKETSGLQTQTWTKDQIELIKRTVAKETTNDELQLFLYIAKRTGLDPFARQIYCVKRWDSTQQKDVMTPQTGIDGFRLVADRTNKYAPGEISWEIVNGKPVSATATIKKLVAGIWHEVSATAFFDEYAQHKKDGTLTNMWIKMPKLMIGKCAEALVLRKAFPAELSGIYTHDEIMQADIEQKPVDIGKPSTQPPQEKSPEPSKEVLSYKSVDVMIIDVKHTSGVTNDKKWTLYSALTDMNISFKTFDTKFSEILEQAKAKGEPVKITYDSKNMIQSIASIREAGQDEYEYY